MTKRAFLQLMMFAMLVMASKVNAERKPDLADLAAGSYYGDVISDAKGSSQSGVSLTITRIDKNLIQITSDYARLPVTTIPLTKAMHSIVQAKGNSPFVLDLTKTPPKLDVSFDNEVSWSGVKQ